MRNRVVALILILVAWPLGIHKFYLGSNFAGIMYLLFSWTLIPGILSFFEFLGLAFMSEEAFNRKFNGTTQSQRLFIASPHQESAKEIAITLGELKKLYDNGIITAEEYESKRRKLLASI